MSFERVTFQGDCSFSWTTFENEFSFAGAKIEGELQMLHLDLARSDYSGLDEIQVKEDAKLAFGMLRSSRKVTFGHLRVFGEAAIHVVPDDSATKILQLSNCKVADLAILSVVPEINRTIRSKLEKRGRGISDNLRVFDICGLGVDSEGEVSINNYFLEKTNVGATLLNFEIGASYNFEMDPTEPDNPRSAVRLRPASGKRRFGRP